MRSKYAPHVFFMAVFTSTQVAFPMVVAPTDEVTCTKDGMTVRVQLPGVGNYIPPYVKGYYNDPNCPATQFKEDLFDVVFSSLTVCGLSGTYPGPYSTTIIIPNRADGIETALDIHRPVSCTVAPTRTEEIKTQDGISVASNGIVLDPVTSRPVTSSPGVSVSLFKIINGASSSLPSSDVLTVGTRVQMKVELADDGGGNYGSIKVFNCTAYPNKEAVESTGKLLTNQKGCAIDDQSPKLFPNFQPSDDNDDKHGLSSKIQATFSLFKFISSNIVYISCLCSICPVTDPSDCMKSNCTSDDQTFGRRKRNVDESTNNTNRIVDVNTIVYFNSQEDKTDDPSSNELNVGIPGTVALSSLSFVSCLAFVITLWLLILERRQRLKETHTKTDRSDPESLEFEHQRRSTGSGLTDSKCSSNFKAVKTMNGYGEATIK